MSLLEAGVYTELRQTGEPLPHLKTHRQRQTLQRERWCPQ